MKIIDCLNFGGTFAPVCNHLTLTNQFYEVSCHCFTLIIEYVNFVKKLELRAFLSLYTQTIK